MTQAEFNREIASALDDLAERIGLIRSEPKHGIKGDELRDQIYALFLNAEKVEK